MGGDEVDAGPGAPAAMAVDVGRAREARGEVARLALVALPEAPDGVAVAAVPFGPAGREAADLIAAHADVPGLGDHLCRGQHRVLGHRVEEVGALGEGAVLAGERGREIEAEAVDPHLLDPVAQGVRDHPERVGMAQLERVPAAGEVVVVALLVVEEMVVGGVVDAAEGQRRPQMAAFGRVVVDDVQDHLDPGIVHHLHEGLDLAQAARPQIFRLRRKEADRVVAPVVLEATLDQMAVVKERFDREQLDRGDTEVLEVIDDGRARQPLEGAALRLRHVGMAHGEAADMGLVDDGLVHRPGRRPLPAPGEGRVDHHALQHEGRAVALVEREILLRIADAVAVERVVPAQLAGELLRIGVEQQLVRVEAVAGVGLVRAVHAVAVALARPRVGQVAVPDLVRHLRKLDALGLLVVVEQAELDPGGVGREDRKIGAPSVPGGAQGIRPARPDASGLVRHAHALLWGRAQRERAPSCRLAVAATAKRRPGPPVPGEPVETRLPPRSQFRVGGASTAGSSVPVMSSMTSS